MNATATTTTTTATTLSLSCLCNNSGCNGVNINNSRPMILSLHSNHTRSNLAIGGNAIAKKSSSATVIEISSESGQQRQQNSSTRRRLILLRHAQSSWDNPSLRDHDRPLSESGKVDAISVSHKLHRLGWIPQLILSSDAARTRETLKIMQEQVRGFLQAQVYFVSSFYSVAAMDGQTADHLQQVVCRYSTDDIFTVMCMGHNRGWEEAASVFSGASVELKTCNAALLEASGKNWEEAFLLAGAGGWKLHGIVKPNTRP